MADHALTATAPRAGLRMPSMAPARVVGIVPMVVITVLVGDYVASALRPTTRDQIWLWTTATAAFPIWYVGAVTSVAVLATVWAGSGIRRQHVVIDVLLVLELGAGFFGTRISPPTGDQFGWWDNAGHANVAMSEPLANVVQKIPFWFTHDLASVRYVAPVFGVLTVAAFLVLARRLSRMTDVPLWVFRAFLLAGPLSFWFVTGYVENTFLALPAFFLGVERLLAHLESGRRSALVAAAAAGSVAALFHAEFVMMLAAFAAALLLHAVPARRRLADIGIATGVAATVAAATLGVLPLLLPIRLVAGNTVGGYDYQWFVPMTLRAGDPLGRFVFFSHAHLIEVSNIVVHAAPAVVLALPVVALVSLTRKRAPAARSPESPPGRRTVLTVLGCCSIAYLLFVASWGFDFGPVGDLDLMLAMGAGLGLYAVVRLADLLRGAPTVLAVILALSGAIDIAYYSVRVANAWL